MTPTSDRAWMAHAACAQAPGLPWTEDTGTFPDVLADIMTQTCATCPVHDACATYATDTPVTGGWWAGQDRDPDTIWHHVEWVPVHNRSGHLLAEQATLPLWNTPWEGLDDEVAA